MTPQDLCPSPTEYTTGTPTLPSPVSSLPWSVYGNHHGTPVSGPGSRLSPHGEVEGLRTGSLRTDGEGTLRVRPSSAPGPKSLLTPRTPDN